MGGNSGLTAPVGIAPVPPNPATPRRRPGSRPSCERHTSPPRARRRSPPRRPCRAARRRHEGPRTPSHHALPRGQRRQDQPARGRGRRAARARGPRYGTRGERPLPFNVLRAPRVPVDAPVGVDPEPAELRYYATAARSPSVTTFPCWPSKSSVGPRPARPHTNPRRGSDVWAVPAPALLDACSQPNAPRSISRHQRGGWPPRLPSPVPRAGGTEWPNAHPPRGRTPSNAVGCPPPSARLRGNMVCNGPPAPAPRGPDVP